MIYDNKILAVVKFNDGEALVLERPINLKWNNHGTTLIGIDGPFRSCLFLDRITPGFLAFAGRKFDIHLENGEVINCCGQYWDGWDKTAMELYGPIHRATASDIKSLKNCYVFCGYYVNAELYKQFRSTYKDIVYDYWEYEMLITSNKYRRPDHKLKPFLRKLRNQRRKQLHP